MKDITSYNVEQSRGDDGHNIIGIATDELGLNVNGAMLWAQTFQAQVEQTFHTAMTTLPQ